MKLDEWRKTRVELINLPSGLEVKVRKISMLDAVMNGELANPLLDVALNAKDGENLSMLKIFERYGPLINEMVKISLVEPAVAEKADATHLAVTELSSADRLEIYNRASGEVLRLIPFRQPGKPDGEPVPEGEGVRDTPGETGGSEERSGSLDAG